MTEPKRRPPLCPKGWCRLEMRAVDGAWKCPRNHDTEREKSVYVSRRATG